MLRRNLRLMLTVAGLVGGLSITFFSVNRLPISHNLLMTISVFSMGSLLGGVLGFFVYPLATWIEGRLAKAAFIDIVFGSIGLIVGLLIAVLIGMVLNPLGFIAPLITVLLSVVFGYLGLSISTRRRDEASSLLGGFGSRRARSEPVPAIVSEEHGGISPAKVLDTSVIIDGRIADIVKTGFLEGPLIIPSFVLEELRHIADSSDVLKRNRGRRGLDILNRIQKELAVEVRIYEGDVGEGLEVDTKLLKLAKLLSGKVVTNDFNLNKVAEFQGVLVLNINDLANSVKPAVLPGEEMTIAVLKDGKEMGQGVAYLDDGTMIVVDGGKRYIGDTIGVVVTSVLQTAAGRMIFAKPKLQADRVAP
jgi:uncharacterized protein YacL